MACLGTEVHLAACPLEFNLANATESCPGGMPAAVSCVPGPEYTQNRAMKKKLKSSVICFACITQLFTCFLGPARPLLLIVFSPAEHSASERRSKARRGPCGGAEGQ